MRFLILLIFLGFQLIKSQVASEDKTNVFTYRLTYAPDSANTDYTREEDFDLQVKGGKSCFVSNNHKFSTQNIEMMGAAKIDIATAIDKVLKYPKSKYRFAVYKEKGVVSYYEKVYSFGLKYHESQSFKWKLSPEKKKIGMYQCQKATTEYGGRRWEAWYTDEVPISEGPYKFHGLPGLIVQIRDLENNFNFSLIAVEPNTNYVLFYDKLFDKYKEVSKKEFFASCENLKQNYVNNAEGNGMTFRPEDKAEIQRRINNKRKNYIEIRE